jgi:hypothetical protein
MVSTDHFRHELLAQLGRGATLGHIDILVNSGEPCRTIPRGSSWSTSCCDAMQAEFKPGDTMVTDRDNGAEMTVRYLMPRVSCGGLTAPAILQAFCSRPSSASAGR